MKESIKSLFSYSLAVSLFSLKQLENFFTPPERTEHRGPAVKAFDAVTQAHTQQFGETLTSVFRMLDNVQRGMVGLTFRSFVPFSDDRSKREREERRDAMHRTSERQRWTEAMHDVPRTTFQAPDDEKYDLEPTHSVKGASRELMQMEDLTEQELDELQESFTSP